jgi:murein DD-endopeptidase MepM/ murein hydrolase activator NlpD
VTYRPPVDAPIIDHFRPPGCTWCPGNRGIDYATAPGTPVGASAAGIVTFAGRVGNDLFVVVAHADGLRTTYAFLATIAVVAGQRVGQGQAIGTTGASLHFGVRRGEVYLDPELLFRGGRLVARLVPLDGGGAASGGSARAR